MVEKQLHVFCKVNVCDISPTHFKVFLSSFLSLSFNSCIRLTHSYYRGKWWTKKSNRTILLNTSHGLCHLEGCAERSHHNVRAKVFKHSGEWWCSFVKCFMYCKALHGDCISGLRCWAWPCPSWPIWFCWKRSGSYGSIRFREWNEYTPEM